jgi:hypothetical protein
MATLPEIVILSSDFGAFAAALGNRLDVGHDTTLIELVYGYSPDGAVFKQIEILPPSATVRISSARTDVKFWCRQRYEKSYAGGTADQKFQALDKIIEAVTTCIDRSVAGKFALLLVGEVRLAPHPGTSPSC